MPPPAARARRIASGCAVVPHLLGLAPQHPVLAAGTARICPILPDAARIPATPAFEGGVLRGGATGVEVLPGATHLLLVTGDALLLLPVDADGIRCVVHQRIDRRLAAE